MFIQMCRHERYAHGICVLIGSEVCSDVCIPFPRHLTSAWHARHDSGVACHSGRPYSCLAAWPCHIVRMDVAAHIHTMWATVNVHQTCMCTLANGMTNMWVSVDTTFVCSLSLSLSISPSIQSVHIVYNALYDLRHGIHDITTTNQHTSSYAY